MKGMEDRNSMLSKRRRAFALATAAAIGPTIFATRAPAATLTWLGTTSAAWDTGGNWSGGVQPGSADPVIFPLTIPSTGSTITLTVGRSAQSLTIFNNYTLIGGSLSLGAGATINTSAGVTSTVHSVLAGPNGLTKTGAGSLVLGGTNT